MARVLQLRSMTKMLLLIVCSAGEGANGFRLLKKKNLPNIPVGVAGLAEGSSVSKSIKRCVEGKRVPMQEKKFGERCCATGKVHTSSLPLLGKAMAYGEDYGTPTFTVVNGLCIVEGLIKASQIKLLAQLPATCRPMKTLVFNMKSQHKAAWVRVSTFGEITWASGSDWISLSGIVFASSAKTADLPLSNNWKPLSYNVPLYSSKENKPSFKVVDGLCIVGGSIAYGKLGLLAKLPFNCRPNKRLIFNLNAYTPRKTYMAYKEETARVDVYESGAVHWIAGRQESTISLSGIIFAASAQRTDLPLKQNWNAYGGYYGTPTFTVVKGLCIVEGLIVEGSAYGGLAPPLARLPANCRPEKRLIFNLNNHKMTARVDVETTGEVSWRRSSWAVDIEWLSLSGIVFATGANADISGCHHSTDTWNRNSNICSTPEQKNCVIAPTCPNDPEHPEHEQIAMRLEGWKQTGFSCVPYYVRGGWINLRTISKDEVFEIESGILGRKAAFDNTSTSKSSYNFDSASALVFDFAAASESMQKASSAGFSFMGFGGGGSNSEQNSNFTADSSLNATSTVVSGAKAAAVSASTYTDYTSNARFKANFSFAKEDGSNIYQWQWEQIFYSDDDVGDIRILSKNWVQADRAPSCFPDQNLNARYTSCLKTGCLPGYEERAGCRVPDTLKESYMGCYDGALHTRVMKRFAYIGACREKCADYMFFGLKKGTECWCGPGEKLNKKRKTNNKCNMACEAKGSETCGGKNWLSVYHVKQLP